MKAIIITSNLLFAMAAIAKMFGGQFELSPVLIISAALNTLLAILLLQSKKL